ncbi:MAG TPA: hypothetical protein VMR88_06035, partial [Candidatus Polarisedimenticolaceae bacterium]|nr:hypothetical protein [Candidatus Polarisedimenticolaceae bacterium]
PASTLFDAKRSLSKHCCSIQLFIYCGSVQPKINNDSRALGQSSGGPEIAPLKLELIVTARFGIHSDSVGTLLGVSVIAAKVSQGKLWLSRRSGSRRVSP